MEFKLLKYLWKCDLFDNFLCLTSTSGMMRSFFIPCHKADSRQERLIPDQVTLKYSAVYPYAGIAQSVERRIRNA